MKKLLVTAILALAISPFAVGVFAYFFSQPNLVSQAYNEKVYVAVEAEGRVAVIDANSRKLIKSIDLSEVQNKKFVKYTTHNVQVSPGGTMVAVTANVDRGTMGEEESTEDISDGLSDKIFFIDPHTDSILYSLPIEVDAHLAHVVIDSTETRAYVASQERGLIYTIDLKNRAVLKTLALSEASEPHGLRLSPDNKKLYVALIGDRAIAEITLATESVRTIPLSGAVIQTAVTPDSKYVFGSVYDTKKVAWIDTTTNDGGYIDLPADAKGSVQLYTTPDSQYLYVVNQGYYFEQPTGNTVYRINIKEKTVDRIIPVGDAPHGLVVDKAGKFVYVTNLLSKDVSVIATETNTEVARITVGKMPNGISVWNRELGGTP